VSHYKTNHLYGVAIVYFKPFSVV